MSWTIQIAVRPRPATFPHLHTVHRHGWFHVFREYRRIDDPELMREGQPSVPETLLLLRQQVECLSKPVQALRDLAHILE